MSKRLFLPVLMVVMAMVSCSKTEVNTVYSSVGGTRVAVSYVSPLGSSSQLVVHAYGKAPDDTIAVWIGDTMHLGDITDVPCDLYAPLGATLPTVRFVTNDSIILLNVDAGTIVHSTPQIIAPITYTFALTDSILYSGDEATLTVKDCPSQLYFQLSNSFVVDADYNFNTADSTATVSITGSHIGTATLHLYNSNYDTTVSVTVQPRYDTYREPELDFDDTRDSVYSKLGNPSSYSGSYVNYDNYQSFNRLLVYFDDNDKLYYYTVEFTWQPTSSDVHAEIEAFLAERYKRYLEDFYTVSNLYINDNEFGNATLLVSLAKATNSISYYNSRNNPIIQ